MKQNLNDKILSIRGMNDLLPSDTIHWNKLEGIIKEWLSNYGYSNIRTPILEYTDLFIKGIGEVTDIVEKEMYSFLDGTNGPSLSMRPEITAGIVRSVIEHNLLYNGPKRLYSMGQVFRHERPQNGRYRQFHQVDVEAFGFIGPDIDSELIIMLSDLWKRLDIKNIKLEINSLGQPEERISYRNALVEYFEKNKNLLDETSKKRLLSNPLRILDSKNSDMSDLLDKAPKLIDFLGLESINHFNLLCDYLDKVHQDFIINNRLVRGLDYYNLTVFEWVSDELGSQSTFCGGGRYDKLIENLGGKPSPAIGFAIGFERLLYLYINQQREKITSINFPKTCDIYIVHDDIKSYSYTQHIASILRKKNISVIVHSGKSNFKQQFKHADLSGAIYAFIIGEKEFMNNTISIKFLRKNSEEINSNEQISIPFNDIEKFLISQKLI